MFPRYIGLDCNRPDMYKVQDERNYKVTLEAKSLWQEFHQYETEMIITKGGRRMFPSIRVQMEHLDPNAQYCMLMEMVPLAKCRFKYSTSGGWAPAGTEEAQSPNRIYVHPDSPASGQFWMAQTVLFGRLKLTNNINSAKNQIVLSSMTRYQPRIIILKSNDPRNLAWAPNTTIAFPETQFIAVTAYQNDKVTRLKIDHNPFAKGFRESGQSKCKRKRVRQLEDEAVTDEIRQEPKRVSIASDPSSSSSFSDTSSERASSPETSHSSISPVIPYQHHIPYPYPIAPIDYYQPFYHPTPYPFYSPPSYVYYNPYPTMAPAPQDLSVQRIEAPRKITDFSIRAITGAD